MKKNVFALPAALTALMTLALLAVICLRALLPALILPRADIPTVVLLCLAALLAEFYLAADVRRNFIVLGLLGALCFGLLPLCAAAVSWQQALKLAAAGAVALPLTTAVFDAACRRRERGTLRVWVVALGWYLAVQAFRGVWI